MSDTKEKKVRELYTRVPEGERQTQEAARPAENVVAEFAYEIVSVIVTAVLLIAVLFSFGCRFVSVVGRSMEPTLHTADWLIVPQGSYVPEGGDVVVISQPNSFGENIVKRVIATEKQKVDIDFMTGKVSVDGQVLNELYIGNPTINSYDVVFPVTVPSGHVFVLGDNRQGSLDSRSSSIGFIRNEYILGKAVGAVTQYGWLNLGA